MVKSVHHWHQLKEKFQKESEEGLIKRRELLRTSIKWWNYCDIFVPFGVQGRRRRHALCIHVTERNEDLWKWMNHECKLPPCILKVDHVRKKIHGFAVQECNSNSVLCGFCILTCHFTRTYTVFLNRFNTPAERKVPINGLARITLRRTIQTFFQFSSNNSSAQGPWILAVTYGYFGPLQGAMSYEPHFQCTLVEK